MAVDEKIAEVVALIGVGLIGGSMGLAIKEKRLANRVIGIARTRTTLEKAEALGAIDEGFSDVSAAAAAADLIVIATPVDEVVHSLKLIAPHLQPGSLVTDVGSTKVQIVTQAETLLPSEVDFVGGHPMAGSHLTGVSAARSDLFEGTLYALTPAARSSSANVHRLQNLARSLGAQPWIMEAQFHDQAVAFTSHLPHFLSSAMVNAIATSATGDPRMTLLLATGFRDMSRLASGAPELWQEIALQNSEAIVMALDAFSDELATLKQALADRDPEKITEFLEQARYRKIWLDSEQAELRREKASEA